MKKLKQDLKTVNRELKALVKKTDSLMKAVDVSIYELTDMYLKGELVKGTDFNWGVAERGVYLVMSEDLLPEAIVAEVNEIQDKVANGEITVEEFRD